MTYEEQKAYFSQRYTTLFGEIFGEESNCVFMGNKDVRACRYCEKSAPDVSFKHEAHSLPHFIGNRWIFSWDECDECNRHFNVSLEDHLAKYLGPLRTITRIKGKKGVPSYKTKDKKSGIDANAAGLDIKHPPGAPIIRDSGESKEAVITMERQPYIPLAAYKSFVKMALSVMPPTEFAECRHLREWIMNPVHSFESFQFRPLMVMQQLMPQMSQNSGLRVALLRRLADVKDCAYMCFVVGFGNVQFQIFLPMPEQDRHLIGVMSTFTFFPTPFGDESPFGAPASSYRDFQSDQLVQGEELKFSFSYGEKIPVEPPQF
jgi:HNH endonuclease